LEAALPVGVDHHITAQHAKAVVVSIKANVLGAIVVH
jgi:hypothetical protein